MGFNLKIIKNWIVSLAIIASAGGMLLTAAVSQPVFAAGDSCNKGFLGFPAWYRGLTNDDCNIKSPKDVGGVSTFIWIIALNVIEIALMAVGYMAVFYMLYGGFQFFTSLGNSDGVVQARRTIINASIGLIISIASVAIVNLIVGMMG